MDKPKQNVATSSTRITGILRFPDEILEPILRHLKGQARFEHAWPNPSGDYPNKANLSRAVRVCRRFSRVGIPLLYEDFFFIFEDHMRRIDIPCGCTLRQSRLERTLEDRHDLGRHCNTLSVGLLDWMSKNESPELDRFCRGMASRFPNTKRLEVYLQASSSLQHRLSVYSLGPLDPFWQRGGKMSRQLLRHALPSLPNLKEFVCTGDFWFDFRGREGKQEGFLSIPIRSLDITTIHLLNSGIQNARSVDAVQRLLMLPKRLENVHLASGLAYPGTSALRWHLSMFFEVLSPHTSLRVIHLPGTCTSGLRGFDLAQFPLLEELGLSCWSTQWRDMENILQPPRLRKFAWLFETSQCGTDQPPVLNTTRIAWPRMLAFKAKERQLPLRNIHLELRIISNVATKTNGYVVKKVAAMMEEFDIAVTHDITRVSRWHS